MLEKEYKNKMISFIKKKYFLFILLLFLLMSIPLVNSDLPFLDTDSPSYLILAQSISSGQGYKDIYYPGNPPNVEFPFFYPLLLAIVLKIYPGNYVIILKLISILFGTGSLIIVHIFFSNRIKRQAIKIKPLNDYYLPLIALFTCTNLWFVSFSTSILPEIPYLFFSFVSLILLNKYEQSNKNLGKYLLFTAFSLTITFFTRSIGLALIMAIIVYFVIIKRKYKKGFYLIGSWFFLSLPWLVRTLLVSPLAISNSYISQFIGGHKESVINILKAIIWNIVHYWQVISSILFPGFFLSELCEGEIYFPFLYGLVNKKVGYFNFKSIPVLFGFLTFGVFSITILGFICQFKKKRLMEIYVLCYLVILFIFTPRSFIESGNRFFIPLLPFIVHYFLTGASLLTKLLLYNKPDIKTGIQKLNSREKNFKVEFAIGFILLTSNIIPVFGLIKANLKYLVNYKSLSMEERKDYYPSWLMDRFMPACWIKENTVPQAIFMYNYPPPFSLVTERKTIYFTETPCPEREMNLVEIASNIRQKGVNYIVSIMSKEEEMLRRLNQEIDDMIFFPLVRFEGINELIKIYKVSKINPQAKMLNKKGIHWYYTGNLKKANEQFKRAIEIDAHPLEYFNLGQCCERENLIKEALFNYEKAVKMESNYELAKDKINILKQQERIKNGFCFPEEYLNLGKLYLKDYKAIYQATYCFKKALKFNSNCAIGHYELGRAYIIDEVYNDALREFEIALKLDPDLKYKIKHYIRIAKQKRKEKQISYLGRNDFQ